MQPFNRNATSELISATSALNTEVTYSGPHRTEEGLVWIPNAEPLVKHSQEHISSAVNLLIEVRKELDRLHKYIDKDKHRDFSKALRSIQNKL